MSPVGVLIGWCVAIFAIVALWAMMTNDDERD